MSLSFVNVFPLLATRPKASAQGPCGYRRPLTIGAPETSSPLTFPVEPNS